LVLWAKQVENLGAALAMLPPPRRLPAPISLAELRLPQTWVAGPRTPKHWKEDADLAGVRDPAALANLPEAERLEWQKLWADVDATLKKAAEPGKK
jgi:hypothetical protein